MPGIYIIQDTTGNRNWQGKSIQNEKEDLGGMAYQLEREDENCIKNGVRDLKSAE